MSNATRLNCANHPDSPAEISVSRVPLCTACCQAVQRSRGTPWSPDDEAHLIALYDTHRIAAIAVELGRTPGSVTWQTMRMRRQGRFPSTHHARWDARAIQRALYHIDSGRGIAVAARRIGRGVRAVQSKLRIDIRLRCSRANGMGITDVARELGLSRYVVWGHIRAGRLAATRMRVQRLQVYTVAQDDVRAFIAQHGGYVPLRPDADWAPLVEEARAQFLRRYIARTAVCALLWVCRKDLWRWEARRDFPRPALRLDPNYGGTHYERSAIWAWLLEHPEHMTRAAREELGA